MKQAISHLFGKILIFAMVVISLQAMEQKSASIRSGRVPHGDSSTSCDEMYQRNLAARVALIQFVACGGKMVVFRNYVEQLGEKKERDLLLPEGQPAAKL